MIYNDKQRAGSSNRRDQMQPRSELLHPRLSLPFPVSYTLYLQALENLDPVTFFERNIGFLPVWPPPRGASPAAFFA
jgi:hypothetical protein